MFKYVSCHSRILLASCKKGPRRIFKGGKKQVSSVIHGCLDIRRPYVQRSAKVNLIDMFLDICFHECFYCFYFERKEILRG